MNLLLSIHVFYFVRINFCLYTFKATQRNSTFYVSIGCKLNTYLTKKDLYFYRSSF